MPESPYPAINHPCDATNGKDEKPDKATRVDVAAMIYGDGLESAEPHQCHEGDQPCQPCWGKEADQHAYQQHSPSYVTAR